MAQAKRNVPGPVWMDEIDKAMAQAFWGAILAGESLDKAEEQRQAVFQRFLFNRELPDGTHIA